MVMYTLLCLKWINNKDRLYITWNSAQCYVLAWMGGSWGENGYTHVNSWVPSLLTWNYPNTNQLYSSIKWKVRNTSKNILTVFSTSCHKNCYSPQTNKNPQWAMKGDHKRKSRMSSQKERGSIFSPDPRNTEPRTSEIYRLVQPDCFSHTLLTSI